MSTEYEAEKARLRAHFGLQADVLEPEEEDVVVTPVGSRKRLGMPKHNSTTSMDSCLSEPWLRKDEAVCPETWLTYNKALPSSPHVEPERYPFKAVTE